MVVDGPFSLTAGRLRVRPQHRSSLPHHDGLPEVPDAETIQRLAEPWRPFRTWAGVLIRVAGQRDGLPWH